MINAVRNRLNWIERSRIITKVQDLFEHTSLESIRYNTLALCGEVGELANLIKKDWRGDRDPDIRDKVADELADVLISAHMLADELLLDVDAICDKKTRELVHRYPKVLAYMKANGYVDEVYMHVTEIGRKDVHPLADLERRINMSATLFGLSNSEV